MASGGVCGKRYEVLLGFGLLFLGLVMSGAVAAEAQPCLRPGHAHLWEEPGAEDSRAVMTVAGPDSSLTVGILRSAAARLT